eukprot:1109294-Heterocapsa_arctica.AAC.1
MTKKATHPSLFGGGFKAGREAGNGTGSDRRSSRLVLADVLGEKMLRAQRHAAFGAGGHEVTGSDAALPSKPKVIHHCLMVRATLNHHGFAFHFKPCDVGRQLVFLEEGKRANGFAAAW